MFADTAPSTRLFFETPVFGGQNRHFQKKKCRLNLTAAAERLVSDASGHIGRKTAQAYNKSSQRCRNQRKLPQTSRAKSFQGNLNKSCQCSENSITDFLRPAFLFPRREKYGMMGLTAVKETGKSEVVKHNASPN